MRPVDPCAQIARDYAECLATIGSDLIQVRDTLAEIPSLSTDQAVALLRVETAIKASLGTINAALHRTTGAVWHAHGGGALDPTGNVVPLRPTLPRLPRRILPFSA